MAATSRSSTKPATAPITSFSVNPVPTNYKPSADCSGVYVSAGVLMIDDKRTCLPERFNPAVSAFYSPGVLCPSGYSAPPGCSRNDGVRSITTVTCCPVRGDLTLSCVDDPATLDGAFSSLFCTWMAGPSTVILATTTGSGGAVQTAATTLQGREGVNAFGVRMVFQATDRAQITTTDSANNSTRTNGSSPATISGASAGLGTGGIVAVAVVIPLVLLAIAGGAFFCWRRRRRNRDSAPPATSTGPGGGQYKPPDQYHGSSYHGSSPVQPSEMSTPAPNDNEYYSSQHKPPNPSYAAYRPPAELPASSTAAELPGDGRRS